MYIENLLINCPKNNQQVSDNKEKAKEVLEDLAMKMEDLRTDMEKSTSTEMAEIFKILTEYDAISQPRNLNLISDVQEIGGH